MGRGFDQRAVLARFGGDTALLSHVTELFRESSRGWLEEMQAARARGDFARLRRVAHTLKGSVGNFLAEDAAAAALRVQELAAAEAAEPLDEALATLATEVHRLLDELTALLAMPSAK